MPNRLSPSESRLLDEFVSRLLAAAPTGAVTAVRVFGSRARGSSGRDSDLDVAVEVAATADPHRLGEIVAEAQWRSEDELDLLELGLSPIVLPPGPTLGLRAAIARDAITWWEAA
jgi:predicted nucleotidyltransferase